LTRGQRNVPVRDMATPGETDPVRPGSQVPSPKGRGSHIAPPNRFEAVHREPDYEQLEFDEEFLQGLQRPPTQFHPDTSKTIVTENNSPDIPFRYSLNPYRGCEHGCAYCYARPTHEYLGLNAGLDFETRIFVKHQAPELFRDFLARPRWTPEVITMSGVTDCYQPAEQRFRLTRGCLEVALQAGQPMAVITKNALVTRDLDILEPMARQGLVHVFLSITTLDAELARTLEPRTSSPSARLRALRLLADAGVPAGVMVAPVIPGLNAAEIPAILQAARKAGARSAGYVMLRLPLTVAPVFLEWLERTQELQKAKVESLIRSVRDGQLNASQWGQRMRGTGEIAGQIEQLFQVFAQKHGLHHRLPPHDVSHFQPPRPTSGQLRLF
jgi:DNA repair photolyase